MPLDIQFEEQETLKELEALNNPVEQEPIEEIKEELVEEPQEVVEQEEVLEEPEQVEEEPSVLDEFPEETPSKNKAWAAMRKALKDREAREQELSEKLANMEGKLDGVLSAATKVAAPVVEQEASDPMPDKEIDPDAYRDWQIQRLEKANEAVAEQQKQIEYANQIQQATQELKVLEDSYAKQDAEYYEKVEYLRGIERAKIKAVNPTASEHDVEKQIDLEKLKFAGDVYNKGH